MILKMIKYSTTLLEDTLFEACDFLDSIKLPFFVQSSTLLGLIRGNGLMERDFSEISGSPDNSMDKEHNFGTLAEYLTEEKLKLIEEHYLYFDKRSSYLGNKVPGLVYFGNELPEGRDPHSLSNGFNLISVYFAGNAIRFNSLPNDCFLIWPKEYIGTPDKWKSFLFKGRILHIPAQPEEYFSYYYGKDWMIEKLIWHWSTDAKNLFHFVDLKEKGEI